MSRTLILGLTAVAALAAAGEQKIIRGEDRFEFTYRVTLPALEGEGRLWLPLARSDAFQTIVRSEIVAPRQYGQTSDRDYGNDILWMALAPADSGKTIEARYEVRRSEKPAYAAAAEDRERDLRPERLVPRHQKFQAIAEEVTRGKTSARQKGRALYDHTLARMKYDKSGEGWGRGDALYACEARAGNCTDFHAYFIALARAAGLPARFAIGFTIPADRDEGVIAGYHCWAEFYAEGEWIPVDISEAARHPELTEYYFGHHPANRFELSVGRDLAPDPLPAGGPINFLVYPLLEVGQAAVPVEMEFHFRRAKP